MNIVDTESEVGTEVMQQAGGRAWTKRFLPETGALQDG